MSLNAMTVKENPSTPSSNQIGAYSYLYFTKVFAFS